MIRTNCSCSTALVRVHRAASIRTARRVEVFRGRKHLVVSVVMLRETVLNGALIRADELLPETWNGVPVTLRHPEDDGGAITANRPDIIERYALGTIFNARVDGDRLCAEAWIDVELASQIAPDVLRALYESRPMDVSVGYFPVVLEEEGTHKGKPYSEVHVSLKPDHLALLPDEEGACNWQDGCGVRTHSRRARNMTNGVRARVAQLLNGTRPAPRTAESGDSAADCAARLVADDTTPFTGDDLYALQMFSEDTLREIEAAFIGEGEGDDVEAAEDEDEDPEAAASEDEDPETMAEDEDEDDKPKGQKKVKTMSLDPAAIATMVQKAVSGALRVQAERDERQTLTARIVANKRTGLSRKDCATLPIATLRKLAGPEQAPQKQAQPATANYGGRAFRPAPEQAGGAGRYPGMVNLKAVDAADTSKEA